MGLLPGRATEEIFSLVAQKKLYRIRVYFQKGDSLMNAYAFA